MQNRRELRQKEHGRSQKTTCITGEKISIPEWGGEDKYHFQTKIYILGFKLA
jgi:hypothetical protein